jgi:hypothetical protein
MINTINVAEKLGALLKLRYFNHKKVRNQGLCGLQKIYMKKNYLT